MPQMPATAATSVSPPAMTVTIKSRATRALRLQHVISQHMHQSKAKQGKCLRRARAEAVVGLAKASQLQEQL